MGQYAYPPELSDERIVMGQARHKKIAGIQSTKTPVYKRTVTWNLSKETLEALDREITASMDHLKERPNDDEVVDLLLRQICDMLAAARARSPWRRDKLIISPSEIHL